MEINCEYFGGPLDGEVEKREKPPTNGDVVHRLFHNKYVTYQWDQTRHGFFPLDRSKSLRRRTARP